MGNDASRSITECVRPHTEMNSCWPSAEADMLLKGTARGTAISWPAKTGSFRRRNFACVPLFPGGISFRRSQKSEELTPLTEADDTYFKGGKIFVVYFKGFLVCRCPIDKIRHMVELADEQPTIEASRQGDPDAFDTLIRRYQKMVHALAFRMTGSLSDAEDLSQETFIQAYQQLGTFRGDARFSSWLYRIAVNQCLNWKKKTERRERLQEAWSREDNTSPVENEIVSRQVQEALLKLQPKQRAAVVLTTYDGLSHAEAAKVLGCSETTVSWRLFAARAKLKRHLQKLRKESR